MVWPVLFTDSTGRVGARTGGSIGTVAASTVNPAPEEVPSEVPPRMPEAVKRALLLVPRHVEAMAPSKV
jgi:3-deoxy-D-manno-octulosonic-acid transferase